ncbi:GtrA family protein [Spirosoma sp. KCTC 42546]|nr:GtrA family protein [Spirosoma sp. KCTC 42546]QDK82918.1 GtrA family protein [Spirosoma sp. KCTC 42546]
MNVSSIGQPKTKEYKDFFSFFLTAVLGASINFVSQIFYRKFFDFDTSVLCGYLTATVLTFIPTKRYAFSARDTGNTGREAIKFLGIAVVALAVQVYVAKYTLEWIANPLFPNVSELWREKGSHVAGMGMSFLANYFGHKLLTFRSTGFYDRLLSRPSKEQERNV